MIEQWHTCIKSREVIPLSPSEIDTELLCSMIIRKERRLAGADLVKMSI